MLNETITTSINTLVEDFSTANLVATIQPLAIFILAIVIYSIFIFKFYRFLAHRDIFAVPLEKITPNWEGFGGKVVSFFESTITYILIYPIILFFWFLVLTVLLILLTKSQPIETIMLISVALIGAVRVTSYYNEDLSKDLAKMMPFALLGVFLVDISAFNYTESMIILQALPQSWQTVLYYLFVIISIELILRIVHAIISAVFKKKK